MHRRSAILVRLAATDAPIRAGRHRSLVAKFRVPVPDAAEARQITRAMMRVVLREPSS